MKHFTKDNINNSKQAIHLVPANSVNKNSLYNKCKECKYRFSI